MAFALRAASRLLQQIHLVFELWFRHKFMSVDLNVYLEMTTISIQDMSDCVCVVLDLEISDQIRSNFARPMLVQHPIPINTMSSGALISLFSLWKAGMLQGGGGGGR